MTAAEALASRLETAAKNMKHAERDGVNASARALQAAALAAAAEDTRGTLTMRGAKAKMAVEVRPSTAKANYAALVRGIPGGPWSWLSKGTRRHPVGAGRGFTSIGVELKTRRAFATRARRAGETGRFSTKESTTRKLLTFGKGNGAAYGPFFGGGSPAKHTFGRAVEKVHPRVPSLVNEEVSKVLRRSLRGR